MPTGHTDEPRENCTTTTSFADHGLTDGSVLVTRTYTRLAVDGAATFEPTEAFFDRLESAFIWAYLGTFDETGFPDHVAAAMDDARVFTREEFADESGADLRTEVIPRFYQHLAGFHCEYRD